MRTFYSILKQHILYFSQIRKLAKIDLLKTYKGATLGWFWAILQPGITIFVYWFAIDIGLRAGNQAEGYPFFLWLIAGMVPWFYISEVMKSGMDSMNKYSYLVTKLKFPISTIPTFVNISKLYIHIILMSIVILIFWAFGYPPSIYLLQLPIYMLLMFTFFELWSLFSSCLAVLSKDFAHLVKALITPLMWLSGILFNPNTIKIDWIKDFLLINPVTYITNGYRNVLIYKINFFDQWSRLLYFEIGMIVLGILALWIYKKTHKEIPDVL